MRFLVLALLFALVAVVCASPFVGAVLDFERRGGGKGGGGGKMLEKLCSMLDEDIAKGESKFAKMRALRDCLAAKGLTTMKDCQVTAYGSNPSTLAEIKHLMCPIDPNKQKAFKDCVKAKGKPDKAALKVAFGECKRGSGDPHPPPEAPPMPGTTEE
jgi:hypothetical protein